MAAESAVGSGNYDGMVDPLMPSYDPKGVVQKLVQLGWDCVDKRENKRPEMGAKGQKMDKDALAGTVVGRLMDILSEIPEDQGQDAPASEEVR